MSKYLDNNGLLYFWNKIKTKFIAEPATEGTNGQVLTTNGNGGRSWTSSTGITVDTTLSNSSTNPVQNKVINTALNGKQATLSVSNASYSNATNFSGTVYVYKYGRVVTIQGAMTPAKTISSGTAWFTLGATYRPIRTIELAYTKYNGGSDYVVTINANGNVTFNKNFGTGYTYRIQCAYISAS